MEFLILNLKDNSIEGILSRGELGVSKINIEIKDTSSIEKLLQENLTIIVSKATLEFLKDLNVSGDYISMERLFYKAYREESIKFTEDKPLEFYLTLFNYIRKELDIKNIIDVERLKISSSLKLDRDFLKGKTILFTGGLTGLKRWQASEVVRSFGGNVASSFSSKIDILICGKNKKGHLISTKRRKAEAAIEKGLPIKLIEEEEFFKIIK